MKESNQKCASSRPPKPNLKNKNFVKWSKAESCKKEDNIVSTEWHEMLKKTPPFLPAYDNKPVNMIYLLSGEYGRLWKKERDDWYAKVFILKPKEKDMMERRKKIRQQIREAQKAAEVSIKERKERRAKELEAKAKAEAEKAEKLRAKVHKLQTSKLTKLSKTSKKMKETKQKPSTEPPEKKEETCPEGWRPVELTLQCECSDHSKDPDDRTCNKNGNAVEKEEAGPESSQTPEPAEGCTMCEGYVQQLQEVQAAKFNMKEANVEPNKETEKEVKPE